MTEKVSKVQTNTQFSIGSRCARTSKSI